MQVSALFRVSVLPYFCHTIHTQVHDTAARGCGSDRHSSWGGLFQEATTLAQGNLYTLPHASLLSTILISPQKGDVVECEIDEIGRITNCIQYYLLPCVNVIH